MEQVVKQYIVVDSINSAPTRNKKIGTEVGRIGDLITLKFEDGITLPFHVNRLMEITGTNTPKTYVERLPELLKRRNSVDAEQELLKMAELADECLQNQSACIKSFAKLLDIIDKPSLAFKHVTTLMEVRNLVNAHLNENLSN